MTVKIQLKEQSQGITYENVENTYTKGPFYCIYLLEKGEGVVYKFPLADIWRVKESYN